MKAVQFLGGVVVLVVGLMVGTTALALPVACIEKGGGITPCNDLQNDQTAQALSGQNMFIDNITATGFVTVTDVAAGNVEVSNHIGAADAYFTNSRLIHSLIDEAVINTASVVNLRSTNATIDNLTLTNALQAPALNLSGNLTGLSGNFGTLFATALSATNLTVQQTITTDHYQFSNGPAYIDHGTTGPIVHNGVLVATGRAFDPVAFISTKGITVRGKIANDQQLYTEIGAGQGKVLYVNADAIGVGNGMSVPTAGIDIDSNKPITITCASKLIGHGCCEKKEFSNGQGFFYTTWSNVNGIPTPVYSLQPPAGCQI